VAAEEDVEALRAIVGQLRTNLEARGRSGLVGVVMGKGARPAAAPVAAAPVAVARQQDFVDTGDDDRGAAVEKPKTGKTGLQVLRDEIGDCQRCKLAPTRKNLVYGVGNPDADLVFVGEAPGADEDAQGEPFVGKAGQLLTKMIEAMGYTRADVYICNVLKCRPPGNRNPEPDEVASCEPFQAPAGSDPAAHDRRAREIRGAVPAARRHAHHAPARRVPQLRGHPADAHAAPRLSAARPEQEEARVG